MCTMATTGTPTRSRTRPASRMRMSTSIVDWSTGTRTSRTCIIATTTAGAQTGFVLLWLVLFSCAVKVAVQIEFARWTIATGTPALSGYNRVPPRLGRIGWVNVLFFLLVVSGFVVRLGGQLLGWW